MRSFDPIRMALLLATLSWAVPARAQVASEAPRVPSASQDTRLVQVVLLLGERTGRPDLVDLPPNTIKAVEDIREFLPYQSYRLLDVALTRTDYRASVTLAGPDGSSYRCAFSFREDLDPEGDRLIVESFDLASTEAADSLALPEAPSGVGTGSARARELYGRALGVSRRSLINSSFAVDIGETIVVGSSKLNGSGQALVVLFTAIP